MRRTLTDDGVISSIFRHFLEFDLGRPHGLEAAYSELHT